MFVISCNEISILTIKQKHTLHMAYEQFLTLLDDCYEIVSFSCLFQEL